MLVRVVKMHFASAYTAEFKTVFKGLQPKIEAVEGCTALQLLQDNNTPEVFFTISYWQNEEYLNAYRNSELFKRTWAIVKPNFQFKAEAWSLLNT